MTEHEGGIFVMLTIRNKNPLMFKLNLKRNAWEEKRELGGLTVFASHPTSLTRAGLSVEERNRIYPSHNGHLGVYYSLGDGIISSRFPSSNYLSNRIAWVDPPHNNFNL
ncbi:BnaC07g15790D [Brassica napus]|uniref:BnaC07g15790D protein n=2 Tax=Brassica napus TaxID=3708 RepID=A0A078FIN6_BRANA|nr:BnaC07g15790D [Brassica napus]